MMPPIVPMRVLLIITAIVVQLPFFTAFFLGNALPTKFVSILYNIGTSWLIVFLYLLLIFVICDLIRLTGLVNIKHFMYHNWYGWAIITAIISTILIIGNINYHRKKRVEINIEISKPINQNNNLKILLISDLHLGYGIGKSELEGWISLLNKEDADVVLIAGDVIDNFTKPLEEDKVYKTLRKIKSKNGVFMALGNHEYIGNIDESINFIKKSNITLLRDTAVLLNDNFYIVGREDFSRQYRKRLSVIMENLDKSKPIIVLDHQPIRLKEARINGADLQLSGHTHNGQVFPINYIAKCIFSKAYGYLKEGETHYFITSGLGLWGGKFRIGTRSEYVVINLFTKKATQ
jgi:predicted MPP superfamily phosphohydrolase